jgi:hypothetical protein
MIEMKSNTYLGIIGMGMAIALMLAGSGCSTVTVNKERIGGIKKVAIIGFELHQKMPPEMKMEFSLGGSSNDNSGLGKSMKAAGFAEDTDHARILYTSLRDNLKRELKWAVEDGANISKHPQYAALYKEKTTGMQSRPMVGEDVKVFKPAGILEAWPIDRLDDQERQALIQKLGVDAIAVASINVELVNTGGVETLVGAGKWQPRSTVKFAVYEKGSLEPVWKDIFAKSADDAAEGTKHILGQTDQGALNKEVVVATMDAYKRLIQRYREAQK